jgi:phosphoadenosine phosphosulfate reductase
MTEESLLVYGAARLRINFTLDKLVSGRHKYAYEDLAFAESLHQSQPGDQPPGRRLHVHVRLYGELHPERSLLAATHRAKSVVRPAEGFRGPFCFVLEEIVSIGSTLDRVDESTPTEQFIAWTVERFRNRRLVITTSFGMEGCALIDMYAAQGAAPTVVYLDTMFLFPETYALRDRMVQRYPLMTFVNRGTSLTPEAQEAIYGPELWQRNPDQCCHIRKVEPMSGALSGADVWVTAVTRSQGTLRSNMPLIAWDWQYQIVKVCPLANWDRPRVWQYVRDHNVPYNELHERGYPSIGCTHCTARVEGALPTHYTRAGRWRESEKTECGLHSESRP